MSLPPIIQQLDESLIGLPDSIITLILVSVSLFGLFVALLGRPVFKAAIAAWFIAP